MTSTILRGSLGDRTAYRCGMAEDLVQHPWTYDKGSPVPRSVVDEDAVTLAVERPPDPLDDGFLLAGGVLAPLPPKVRLPHEDDEEEGEDDDEEPDPDDVEADLDTILKDRLVVAEEEEDEDDEPLDPEDKGESGKVRPKAPGEFVCQSCFLVKHPSQLADEANQLCRDCV